MKAVITSENFDMKATVEEKVKSHIIIYVRDKFTFNQFRIFRLFEHTGSGFFNQHIQNQLREATRG